MNDEPMTYSAAIHEAELVDQFVLYTATDIDRLSNVVSMVSSS